MASVVEQNLRKIMYSPVLKQHVLSSKPYKKYETITAFYNEKYGTNVQCKYIKSTWENILRNPKKKHSQK